MEDTSDRRREIVSARSSYATSNRFAIASIGGWVLLVTIEALAFDFEDRWPVALFTVGVVATCVVCYRDAQRAAQRLHNVDAPVPSADEWLSVPILVAVITAYGVIVAALVARRPTRRGLGCLDDNEPTTRT